MCEKNNKLTILCINDNTVGIVNATLGIAFALKRRNHRIVFATNRSWQGKFVKMGFEEEIYGETPTESELIGDFLKSVGDNSKKPPDEQILWLMSGCFVALEQAKFIDKHMSDILKRVKPNVIIVEFPLPIASLIKSNLPLVFVHSINPLLAFNDEKLPPFSFGLPLADRSEWISKRKLLNETIENLNLMKTINEYLEENSIPSVPKHKLKHNSTNLNVYIYPKPLVEDYLRLCALNDTWLGLDHSIRERQESFELPRSFRNEGERLIFLSMGTLGSNNVELMSHLCTLLAKCKHKIIVSRGHSHEMYKLAENMWGEAYLPQLEVLPLVDLVIFHGGSNTLIESLYYAKPMIVMPLFGDQHDNAQRVVEMNVGIKLNAFTVEENELLNSIECLLEDTEMAIRLKKISNCMKESKSMDALINRVEKIAKEPKIPNVIM